MAQILLTGASGFVGSHLLRELVNEGHHVRALSRTESSDRQLAAYGAKPVRGELNDQDSLHRAAQGVETIFHCAANTSAWSRDKSTQWETNVEGTRRLLLAGKQASIMCFAHTSSVSAFSHQVHETLTEGTPQLGYSSWVNYERSKFAGEQLVRDSGLPYLIFNPSHVLGPGDTNNWSRLIRLIDQDKLPGVPPGVGVFADVREIAKAQNLAWQLGIRNEAFLLGGQQASFLQLTQMIARLVHRKPPKRVMPESVLMLVASLSQGLSYLTGKMPQITPASVALTCHHLSVDSSKAIKTLGYQETDLNVLLQDTIDWLRAENLIRPMSI
ncbi:MAG: NAD-dependent epimerase/dehydratase family protein [Arenimonas sp.]|nr:NAD-dependent epimerase/dehydratase family protein [Arenimonas sp.]